jgi:hypothetical protein
MCLVLALVSTSSRSDTVSSSEQSKLAIVEAIKLSLEDETPHVSHHRAKFLQSLEKNFPESMKESMNFSIDPCRFGKTLPSVFLPCFDVSVVAAIFMSIPAVNGLRMPKFPRIKGRRPRRGTLPRTTLTLNFVA